MKINWNMKSFFRKLDKYKYTGLVLLLGVVLMLLPQREKEPEVTVIPEEVSLRQQQEPSLEDKLAAILQKMDGVGAVEVLLSVESGPVYEYQVDRRISKHADGEDTEEDTVLISDSTNGESPVVVKSRYPTYQGALVLCQGADSASVRLQIVQAVSDLTGLGSDRISVIKMKGN